MNTLSVDASMRAMIGGAFYPTGHTMVMFASEHAAREAARQLAASGHGGEVYLAPPSVVLTEIAPTVHDADQPLPSIGTDAATAREFIQLAHDGQTGLLVQTRNAAQLETLQALLQHTPYTLARRYGQLVIEDL